jgi:group II intron reverse transcriptase/maturase
METKLRRLTEIARGNSKVQFTSLAHYLNEEFLKACYEELKKDTAAGVDRVTVEEYGKQLGPNLRELVKRMKTMSYRPQPVRRVYMPKDDGSQRPLGIPAVEDRIVQRGIAKILSAIYEGIFLDVSFGFRPERNAHQALGCVDKAIATKPVACVVDVDIEKFFDRVDHPWMMKCLEQRIKDTNLLRLIARFLKSGVMEEGSVLDVERGTPQGGNLSPVLANVFLHYVLDLWFERVIKPNLTGYAELTRFCDDFIVVFEREEEAEAFVKALPERLAKFGLKVKEAKSSRVKFGRGPWGESLWGESKTGTFDFLGFTHFCATTRKGKFKVGRKTSSKRLRKKLKALNLWMKSVRNQVPLKEWWPILRSKLRGHFQYYGVSGNTRGLDAFHWRAMQLAYKWVNRRSQKRSYNRASFGRYLQWNPLPMPRIYHNLYALS